MRVRVFDLAKELGKDSRSVLLVLRDLGVEVRSASSIVPRAAVDHLRTNRDLIRNVGSRPFPTTGVLKTPAHWWSADQWWERAPAEITTREAAMACRTQPATIRQWVSRGHLTPCGRRGRSDLFAASDVRAAQERITARRRLVRYPLPVDRLVSDQTRLALVTAAEAAVAADVAPSTIRMWVLRGHLAVHERRGNLNYFLLTDVRNAARRR